MNMPLELVEGQEFCGVPEYLGASGNCRWATKEVSYGFAGFMQQLGPENQRQLTRIAWSLVEASCGVTLVETSDLSKANIVISAARGTRNQFDGPSGTLAWCELPCGNVSQVRLMFDLDETWAKDSASGGIQYMLVCLHEGMHGLGLPHAPSGSSNVMAPVYAPRQTALGQWDIAELQRRYGLPSAPSPVPGVPADQVTIADLVVLNTKTGKKYTFLPSIVSLAGLT